MTAHYCPKCTRSFLAPDDPNDRPICYNGHKPKAMKPGYVQTVSRETRLEKAASQ